MLNRLTLMIYLDYLSIIHIFFNIDMKKVILSVAHEHIDL